MEVPAGKSTIVPATLLQVTAACKIAFDDSKIASCINLGHTKATRW